MWFCQKVMKILFILSTVFILTSCVSKQEHMVKIVFLRRSTGQRIWIGNTNRYIYKLTEKGDIQAYFQKYNRKHKTNFRIEDMSYPHEYKNHVFDYYNIWVKHAGEEYWGKEETLEIMTEEYNIIIFKHCYPVSRILEDTGFPDIDSKEKRLENYKLQYLALKSKMHEFPRNKFIVWTPAVHVEGNISSEEALRTKEFHSWLVNEWDEKGDNIFLWDFYQYETEGGLYLSEKHASGKQDSHPSQEFGGLLAPVFSKFIINVAKGKIE